jgi:hypothetical protein
MPYLYATEDQDFSDFASGRVIYNLPGAPAFPVRLASEMLLRALGHLPTQQPVALFDPTCGGAYHLTALGFLHGERIHRILASDSSDRAVALAQRNLGLLTLPGLAQRTEEIRSMLASFQKESHAAALQSVERLRERLESLLERKPIPTRVFQANALDAQALRAGLEGEAVQVVLCDIPYGLLSAWDLPGDEAIGENSPVWRLLDSLQTVVDQQAVVVIAADKGQKIAHPGYRRVERFQVGKRQVALLTLI